MAKACSAGRMERCTCDESPDLENRKAWQWGGCGDNLKYSNKFVKDFLTKKSNKDLRASVDFHNTLVGMKVSTEKDCFILLLLRPCRKMFSLRHPGPYGKVHYGALQKGWGFRTHSKVCHGTVLSQ